MLSAVSSLIWGDSSTPQTEAQATGSSQPAKTGRSSSSKRKLNKNRLIETEIKASDGDEWVLISDRMVRDDKKSGKTRTVSNSSSSSSSPKAKKSRGKETSAFTLDLKNQVPVVIKKMKGTAKADKLHRRLKDQDLLSEGDMMLQQIFNEDPVIEQIESEEFPTIQEANLIRSRSNSWNNKTRHSRGTHLGSPKSYAEMAATSTATSEELPASSAASCATSSSSDNGSSSQARNPAILVVTSSSKGKRRNKSHGLSGTMEGSWFVTPPPCFTKPNTFSMESSPLEDQLIEMPSISGLFDNQNKASVDKDVFSSLEENRDVPDTDDLLTNLTPIVSAPSSPVRLIHEVIHPFDGYPIDSPTRLSRKELTSKKKRANKSAVTAVVDAIRDNKISKSLEEKEEKSKERQSSSSLSSRSESASPSSYKASSEVEDYASEEEEDDEMTPRNLRQLSQLPSPGIKGVKGRQLPLTEVQLNSYTILSRKEKKGRTKRRKDKKPLKADDSNGGADSVSHKRSPSTERVHAGMLFLDSHDFLFASLF